MDLKQDLTRHPATPANCPDLVTCRRDDLREHLAVIRLPQTGGTSLAEGDVVRLQVVDWVEDERRTALQLLPSCWRVALIEDGADGTRAYCVPAMPRAARAVLLM